MSHVQMVLWAAFGLGILFGALAQRSEFCMTGGMREWLREAKPRRMAVFLLAMGVAVAVTQSLVAAGLIDIRSAFYLNPGFSWLTVPFGGMMFGYGMVMARGCGARALVLLGDGNLRSLLVLFCLGLSAGMAQTGLLARLRLRLVEATAAEWPDLPRAGLGFWLESWGVPAGMAGVLPALVILVALAVVALGWMRLRRYPWQIVGAVAIGLLIPVGWWITSRLGYDDFDPVRVESLTFVAPVGNTLQYVMLSTGTQLQFGVAVVGGILLGSLIMSLATRSFELRGFQTPGQMLRAVGGGILMGVGGVMAMGCSIGQGITGLSTLALPSFLAAAGILVGGTLALRGPLQTPEE